MTSRPTDPQVAGQWTTVGYFKPCRRPADLHPTVVVSTTPSGPGRTRTCDRAIMSRLSATPSSRIPCHQDPGSVAAQWVQTGQRDRPSQSVSARSRRPGSIWDPFHPLPTGRFAHQWPVFRSILSRRHASEFATPRRIRLTYSRCLSTMGCRPDGPLELFFMAITLPQV